jgi:hypothetical protein
MPWIFGRSKQQILKAKTEKGEELLLREMNVGRRVFDESLYTIIKHFFIEIFLKVHELVILL